MEERLKAEVQGREVENPSEKDKVIADHFRRSLSICTWGYLMETSRYVIDCFHKFSLNAVNGDYGRDGVDNQEYDSNCCSNFLLVSKEGRDKGDFRNGSQ